MPAEQVHENKKRVAAGVDLSQHDEALLGLFSQLVRWKEAYDRAEAELLAAQERDRQLREVWESVPGDLFDHTRDPGAGEAWREQYIARMVEAKQAQEREKALREALERIAQPSADVLSKVELAVCKDVARTALAGSPSEKPSKDAEGAKP